MPYLKFYDPAKNLPDTSTPATAEWANHLEQGIHDATSTADAATAATAALADSKAAKTTKVQAGSGLAGGGDLSADRTLAVDFGTAAGKVAQGNDPRIVKAAALPDSRAAGDLLVWDGTAWVPLTGGATGQILTRDTTLTTKTKWADAAGGSGAAWSAWTALTISSANLSRPTWGRTLAYRIRGDEVQIRGSLIDSRASAYQETQVTTLPPAARPAAPISMPFTSLTKADGSHNGSTSTGSSWVSIAPTGLVTATYMANWALDLNLHYTL